eukprot:s240_g17.t1
MCKCPVTSMATLVFRESLDTLLAYITDHADLHRRLEKQGVSLPTAVQGWHLLRKCGLTKEQRQVVNLRAPTLELTKVLEAVYLLLGQDHDYKYAAAHAHHGADRRWNRGKGGRVCFGGDDVAKNVEENSWDWDPQSKYDAYWEWDDYDNPEDYGFDDDAAYYQQTGEWDGESTIPEDSTSVFDVDTIPTSSLGHHRRREVPVVGRQGQEGKSTGKPNNFKYDKASMKPAQPQQRAQAALQGLRSGQKRHFAANCPVNNQKTSPNKRPAPLTTESMAKHSEGALVTFMDKHGHEHTDVAMLDAGASAFLCGYGAMSRYLYPVDSIHPLLQV